MNNNESISAFARLLATENIVVRHSPDAQTASFGMTDRVLTLPVWRDMTPALYDMLVGHEVAHAIWTDATVDEKSGHLAGCVAVAPDNPASAMPIVNVVEDARIERLIKAKYPGLKRDFVSGYKHLLDMDLFQIEDQGGVSNMGFLDRLNLHFKLGILGHLNVPFHNDTEIWFRDRIADAKTWDEVIDISRDLYEYDMQQQEDAQQDTGVSAPLAGDSDNADGSPIQSNANDSSDATTDDSDSDGSQQGDGDESDDASTDGGEGDDSNDQSVDSSSSNGAASGYTPDVSTQRAMDEGLIEQNEWHKPKTARDIVSMPKPDLDKMIIPATEIAERHINAKTTAYGTLTASEQVTRKTNLSTHYDMCDEFMSNEKSTVNYLSKQFEMRKAADIHKRTMSSKTGRLDPIKMINYRWSEDIFAKNTTVRDGKNHGFVAVLDWSGSMSSNLLATVKQAITLAMFCRKVNIPFDLHAFTDRGVFSNYRGYGDNEVKKPVRTWNDENYITHCEEDGSGWTSKTLHDMHLLNFLSSDMNTRQFKVACRILYSLALTEGYSDEGRHLPHVITDMHLGLGGTPLDESIVTMHSVLPAFRAKHGVQVLNCVFLSDGDGHGTFHNQIIQNPITRRSYGSRPEEAKYNATCLLLQSLKETTGANLIGMYLHAGRNCFAVSSNWFNQWDADEAEMKDAKMSWKKNNYYVASGNYSKFFDEAYIINADINPETELNLPDSGTRTNLRNAFVKGMKSRGMSRNLSNRFIEVVAR